MKLPHVRQFFNIVFISLICTSILNPAAKWKFSSIHPQRSVWPYCLCCPINISTSLFHSCRKQLILHEVKQTMKPPLCANGATNKIRNKKKKRRNCTQSTLKRRDKNRHTCPKVPRLFLIVSVDSCPWCHILLFCLMKNAECPAALPNSRKG
jgi:hypothetical protein